jgi:Uma2 family endonuclease
MGVGTLISEEEYLHTNYTPDCEFEDGVLIERNVGTKDHSKLQRGLIVYFGRRSKAWGIHVFPEVRIRIRTRKYLLPDICVVSGAEPPDQVFQAPPLIVIEILSPEDRTIRVNRKVKEWRDFGVPYVWVIDPETLESELHDERGTTILSDGILRIPGTPIEVPLHRLDEDE